MDKKSTPSKYALQQRGCRQNGDDMLPSRLTIAMIRQFARSYHYDARVDRRLGGMIVY